MYNVVRMMYFLEHLKMGITTHARTSTNIKGSNVKLKLHRVCSTCPELYIVTKSPTYKPKVNGS